MRPRHRAAEYTPITAIPFVGEQASMRPRHRAAEYPRHGIAGQPEYPASMRPRHRAAEYARVAGSHVGAMSRRFNEAAA